MTNKALGDYTVEDMLVLLNENVDAIVMVDTTIKKYRSITRKSIFKDIIDETGDYDDFIQKLWFHLSNSQEEITEDYKAFVSYYGQFNGKYSRRFKVFLEGSTAPYVIQMNVYPMEGTDKYLFAMDVLDDEEVVEEYTTTRKVNTIQNTYLFSMFVDLVRDSTSSISVTEISEDTVKASIKYSQWRLMTVNMIWPEDQRQFLMLTDPDYLRDHLEVGRTNTYDCKMKNLEGEYIWVKLIFSRAQTISSKDFKFVFMVQNIDEAVKERMETLKKYEELVMVDPLTGLINHGGIKTEIENAIDIYQNGGESISLMMIDLDNFKKINDNYGHSVGDATLRTLADVLKGFAKDKNASVGRWGGEEFVTILSGVSHDEAVEYAEDLRRSVAEADFGKAGHITCSVGISQLGDEDSFDDIFDRMDKAMYSSKIAGRNRVTVL